MINVEDLARKAINIIKDTWGLPDRGFIAGGSISNIIWELVSGNKAIVNDVDVFLFDGIMTHGESLEITTSGKKMSYLDKDFMYQESYRGLSFVTSPKEFYKIERSEKEGIFNYIYYRSSVCDPNIIINSFDINCTAIGYNIEEDKFYWLKSFEKFLETGELKVSNLTTPCHTAIRICKKQDELNVKLDEFEYSLLSYAINNRFADTNKTKFSTRYFELYKKYREKLPSYFIERRENDEAFMKDKGIDIELYTLIVDTSRYYTSSKLVSDVILESGMGAIAGDAERMFDDKNLYSINSSRHFLFYMRNIYKNERLKSIWSKTKYFFTTEDYIDVSIVDEKNLDRLFRITEVSPNTIENLKGVKLSSQLEFIEKLFNKFEGNLLSGISILEKHKMIDIDLNDDSLLLILELTVRRNVVNDKNDKVNKILGEKFNSFDSAAWCQR